MARPTYISRDIRAKFATILAAAPEKFDWIPAAGNWAVDPENAQIYPNRIKNLAEAKLPCLNIQTITETGEILNDAALTYNNKLRVVVFCMARADDGVDDILDDMAYIVRQAILKAEVENGYSDLGLNHVDYVSKDMHLDLANSQIASASVVFEVDYDDRIEPDLDDLETVNTKIKTGSGDVIFENTETLEQDESEEEGEDEEEEPGP